MVESKDVSVYDFVANQEMTLNYKSIKILTNSFRNFIGTDNEKQDLWLNEKWFGRALKRLNLIVDKKRVAGGVEVTLNIHKAKSKMREFNYGLKKENPIIEIPIKTQILDYFKDLDSKDEFFKITDEVKSKFNLTETEIRDILTELLSEGLIYEPRKDVWRYLG